MINRYMKDASIGGRELYLFVINSKAHSQAKWKLWRQMAIARRRTQLGKSGAYDREYALRKFKSFGNAMAVAYVKEKTVRPKPKPTKLFDDTDRTWFAKMTLADFEQAWREGSFEALLPRNVQRAATQREHKRATKLAKG